MESFIQYASYVFMVKYKSFDEIEEEKAWWKLPSFVSEFLHRNGSESALKMFFGSETVPARQFVEYAFGHSSEASFRDKSTNNENNSPVFHLDNAGIASGLNTKPVAQVGTMLLDKYFWKNFADVINQNVVQKLGVAVPEKLKWDGFDLLNKICLQSQKIAEAKYIESGFATPDEQDIQSDKVLAYGFVTLEDPENKNDKAIGPLVISTIQLSFPDIKKATQDLLRQANSVLGKLMVLTAAVSKSKMEGQDKETKEDFSTEVENKASGDGRLPSRLDCSVLDEKKAEEMKELFATAESAMEDWQCLPLHWTIQVLSNLNLRKYVFWITQPLIPR
ncbi:hypothetical protein PTKIN_Ptkin17bG0063300 [Pterospermum kingtungense]